jgi:hypothetical protein
LLNDRTDSAFNLPSGGERKPESYGSGPFSRKLFAIEERVFTEHNLRPSGACAIVAVAAAAILAWRENVRGDWVVSRDKGDRDNRLLLEMGQQQDLWDMGQRRDRRVERSAFDLRSVAVTDGL